MFPRPTLRVITSRHLVTFRDGSTVGLHPVWCDGYPQLLLRAVAGSELQPSAAGQWLCVDLTRLRCQPRPERLAELADDLRRHPARDHEGIVLFTLRGAYRSAQAFATAALACGHWLPEASHPRPIVLPTDELAAA